MLWSLSDKACWYSKICAFKLTIVRFKSRFKFSNSEILLSSTAESLFACREAISKLREAMFALRDEISELRDSIWLRWEAISLFLFSISLIGELLKHYFIKLKKLATTYLLIINFLRIFLCFLFLLPIILNYQKSDNTYIYNFFICYFLHLFYDIIMQSKNQIK